MGRNSGRVGGPSPTEADGGPRGERRRTRCSLTAHRDRHPGGPVSCPRLGLAEAPAQSNPQTVWMGPSLGRPAGGAHLLKDPQMGSSRQLTIPNLTLGAPGEGAEMFVLQQP